MFVGETIPVEQVLPEEKDCSEFFVACGWVTLSVREEMLLKWQGAEARSTGTF